MRMSSTRSLGDGLFTVVERTVLLTRDDSLVDHDVKQPVEEAGGGRGGWGVWKGQLLVVSGAPNKKTAIVQHLVGLRPHALPLAIVRHSLYFLSCT